MSATAQTQDWPAHHTSESVRREFLPTGHIEWSPRLDRPSEPHRVLQLWLNGTLTQLLLLLDGATSRGRTNVQRNGKKGGLRAVHDPTSELAGIVESLDLRFRKSKTTRQRLLVMVDAQSTLNLVRYSPDRSLMRGTREWKEKVAHDARPQRVLASVYGVSQPTVCRIKKEFRVR